MLRGSQRFGLGILILVLFGGITTFAQTRTSEQSSPGSGPKSSTISSTRDEELRNVAEEDAELDYLYERHEVGRDDYLLTKDRHFALRTYLLTLPKNTIDLPELYVMTKAEFKNFFHTPPTPEKMKIGGIWEKRWVYRAKITRRHIFYVFERQ